MTGIVPVPLPQQWTICPVGEKWGVMRPWVDDIYWLRLFDTEDAAAYFVRTVTSRMDVVE